MNFIKRHVLSYRYAFRGIWIALRYEPNMIIHVAAALVVIVLNVLFGVGKTEWLVSLLLIGVVFAAEIFNTAIEKFADHVTPDHHPMIGMVKDLSAGAVLIICLAAVACGVIMYWPYIAE